MNRLVVKLKARSYPIYVGSDVLGKTGELLRKTARGKNVAIITNPKVDELYGKQCAGSLKKAGFNVSTMKIPDGERYKTLKQIERIYDFLIRNRFDRTDSVVALGGGVTGDMAGFASATYMRGIDYIQIPTTLLAQVDSSVGGKTGVDHSGGKNIIGAFYQPKMVLADLSALSTLPEREFTCGMAEVIKYGVIRSLSFFRFLERSAPDILARKKTALHKIVEESCKTKAEVVEKDEMETGVRAILNFGHTFGHGVETAMNFRRIKHGEAVGIGMVLASRLSEVLGLITHKSFVRVKSLVSTFGLPTELPRQLTPDDVLRGMRHDKKIISGKQVFIVFDKIGKAVIRTSVSENEIMSAMGSV